MGLEFDMINERVAFGPVRYEMYLLGVKSVSWLLRTNFTQWLACFTYEFHKRGLKCLEVTKVTCIKIGMK